MTLNGPEYIPSISVTSAVIFLHGLGSNGDDLMGLAPLMRDSLPSTAFLAPNAPLPLPHSYGGYQWFEYWDRTPAQIADGIAQSTPMLIDFVKNVAARFDLPLSKIVLVGFSQGTMMSLQAGLRSLEGLGGIVGFSGALMSPETLAIEKNAILPPVLLVHGLQDPVVPALASQQAEMVLNMLGGKVTLVQRPFLQHSIDDEGIRQAVAFCRDIFTE